MSASFEDTVFDFDLNFLNQPTTSNTEQDTQTRLEKLRRSIVYLKKKVVFADAAVCRYKTARHYARVLENNQLYSNEGCKQHLIEIRSFIDKVGQLETENRQLEERVKEKNKEIDDLQNKYQALEKAGNQIQLLLKEKSKQPDPPKAIAHIDKEKKKDNCKSCSKNQLKYDLLDKEVEALRKDNNKLSWLERDNEKLRKENARIPSLAQEILQLRKEVSDLVTPESINDGIKKATAKIQYLQKEIDDLQKENSKIGKLEKEIEVLRLENAKAKNFEKEIAKLHKETAKIPKLKLENEILRKECTKVSTLEKEVSVLSVKNAKLANSERLHKNLCDELVKIPNKGKELENLLSRFNLAIIPTGTSPPQEKSNSVHNDTSDVDDIESEETVVPSTPVHTVADKQPRLVKSSPEPHLSTDDDITEVVNVDTGCRTSLNNSNIETPSKSLIQIKDSVVTSTVPVIVYNDNQGLHRNRKITENIHTENVSIVSKCVPKDITSPNNSEDHTTSKYEVKESILSATVPTIVYNQNLDVSCKKINFESHGYHDQIERMDNDSQFKENTQVPTIVYNENNISYDDSVIESQEYHTQKVSTIPKCVPNNNTPNANTSDNKIAMSKVQFKESVITAAVPTIVYNQNVDYSSNDNANEAQGHRDTNAHESTQITRERESLELNNSKVRETHIELELEKIFSNMKMFNAVTPIPKTPTRLTEEKIITDPTEKLLKCMMLSDKSDKLLLKLKEYMHSYTKDLFCQSNPRFQSHTGSKRRNAKCNIDKLIQCFETILRSQQILSDDEDSMDTQPNLQILEQPLYNEENNLESITNEQLPETDVYNLPEDRENMHAVTDLGGDTDLCDNTSLIDESDVMQEDTHILPKHQEDLSVPSSENVIESPATPLPEKDIIILHNFQISKPVTDRKQEKSRKPTERCSGKNKMYKATDSVRRSNIPTQKKKPITRGVKKVTCKKHTQLDKLKKRLEPKYKIRRESPLLRKSNLKPKSMPPTKKTVSVNDTSASLNSKDVYEKAVKVMAEINSQKSKMLKSPPVRRKSMLSPTHKMPMEYEFDLIPNSPPRMTRAMSLKLSGLEIDTDISDKVPMASPKNTHALLSPKVRNSSEKEAGQNVDKITTPTTCKGTLPIATDSSNNVSNSTPKQTEGPLSSKLNDSMQTEIIVASEDIIPTSPVEDPKTPFTYNIETSSADKVLNSPPKQLKASTMLESTMDIEVDSSCGGIISNLPPKEPITPSSTMHLNMKNDKMPNPSSNEKRDITLQIEIDNNVDIALDTPIEEPTTSRRKSATYTDIDKCDKGPNSPPKTLLTMRRKSVLQTEMNANGDKEQNSVSSEVNTPVPARRKSVVQFEINSNGGDKVASSLNREPKTPLSMRRKSCLQVEINKDTDKVQSSPPKEPKTPLSPRQSCVRPEIHNESNKVLYSPPKLTKSPLSPRLRSFTQNECNSSNSSPKQIKALLSPRSRNSMSDEIDRLPQKILITPRTKRKISELFDNCAVVLTKDETILDSVANKSVVLEKSQEETEQQKVRAARRKRRSSSDEPLVQPKRILRSSNQKGENDKKSGEDTNAIESTSTLLQSPKHTKVVTYDDLDMWSDDDHQELSTLQHQLESDPTNEVDTEICHPKESILCRMIEKYGVESVKPFAKKPSDYAIKQLCEKIEKEISAISELPMNETKNAMNKFVTDLRKINHKLFISSMMKYLTKPERKQELFGKVSLSAAPAMTKAEQILLYVVAQLKNHWPIDVVDAILSNIEYTLFRLNRTPEFEVIESMSHFYALLCRYIGAKSRLRLFILDAMYCIQYKSVPLIKQCIEVWMHIIPLAHMGIAKNPLVTCLVYLLHFYKCDDKLNRVQDIRNILSRKYFYQITDWNETKILEMFKNCIKDLKDISIDKKTLRLALIILAKRHGPRWCQNNIIKNLLQPMIEKEGVSDTVKEFCVSMIGPLMKPYPVDMKIYCEIAMNQLTDILNNNPSPKMEEAVITSMLFINRHNQDSINKILLARKMKPLSPDLEKTLCDYVKTKPLKVWKKHLSVIAQVT